MTRLIFAVILVVGFNLQAATDSPGALAATNLGDQAVAEAAALTGTENMASAAKADAANVAAAPETTKTISMKNLKETEIPVNLESGKKADSAGSSIFKIILTFAILGTLGCGGYFFFKKYSKMKPKNQANQIKILTQHYLGPKKSLAIIRVAGESVLIGITDHNINMIKSLSLLDEDIPEEAPKSFGSVFTKLNNTTQFDGAANATASDDIQDEFSFSGIKDFVSSRLKNMRTLE